MGREPKYKTCRHIAGKDGEFIVYVNPSCQMLYVINGTMCSSKMRCRDCKRWEPREENK